MVASADYDCADSCRGGGEGGAMRVGSRRGNRDYYAAISPWLCCKNGLNVDMKKWIALSAILLSPNALGQGVINVLGCRLYLPPNFESYYRSDGSMSFNYGESSINISKFGGYLKGGIVGNDELTVSEFKEGGLNFVYGAKINRVTKSAIDIIQITDGVSRLSIIGSMAKEWRSIFKDCNAND